MINIAQSNPVVWSPPVSGATAPVTPVAAVRPLQENARDGQPGTGAERDARAARADRRTEAREADRQTREAISHDDRRTTGRTGTESSKATDAPARQEAEDAKQLAAEQAADEARRAQRQELLTNVWKASAAVVNRVLGRDEAATAINPAAESSPADLQPLEPLPWPVMPQEASSPLTPTADFPAPEDVVAYDERGNGNTAPVETGMLVSERV